MRLIYLLSIGALGSAVAWRAQAQAAPDCPPQPAQLCVDFDARRSVDPAAGALTYLWQMGDGTTLTGLTVTHCYAELKDYTVQLDVRVDSTGEIRRAERTFPVLLRNQDIVDFTASALQVHVGEAVVFDAPQAQLPSCGPMEVSWDFRDGLLGQGKRITHTFRKPGTFAVRLILRAYGNPTCHDSHCASRAIVVVP